MIVKEAIYLHRLYIYKISNDSENKNNDERGNNKQNKLPFLIYAGFDKVL